MPKYKKLPREIEAMQWDGSEDGARRINEWAREWADTHQQPKVLDQVNGQFCNLWVQANSTWLPIEGGEWVAHDSVGFYPIKDAVFTDTYEEVAGG